MISKVSFISTAEIVVECKLWKSRVTKEKVMALKSIVDDLGVDKGIIICEKGFQKGAISAAKKTNIELITCLENFEEIALMNIFDIPLILNNNGNGSEIYEYPTNQSRT